MKTKLNSHYVCGICGGCYFSDKNVADKNAADDCCKTKKDRLFSGINEKEYQDNKEVK